MVGVLGQDPGKQLNRSGAARRRCVGRVQQKRRHPRTVWLAGAVDLSFALIGL